MNNLLPQINFSEEKKRIVSGLRNIFAEQKIDRAVIGLSGGIDSTVSFFLLKETLLPKNIFVAHLFYSQPHFEQIKKILEDSKIPKEHVYMVSIKEPVDAVSKLAGIENHTEDKLRKGNIAARMRMIMLFDLAKKYNALVCGTENKTENLLGYFTRFGDQASDIEPISGLYKTHIFQLAKHLDIPKEIINQEPTAGLWEGQTDEGQFGFTYQEADQVLYLATEKGQYAEEIETQGFPNAKKILEWKEKNAFKHHVPYIVK